jgi:hypothetical protein
VSSLRDIYDVPKATQTKEDLKKFSHRHKKSTALHGCAVGKSRGQEYPLTICRKEKETKQMNG